MEASSGGGKKSAEDSATLGLSAKALVKISQCPDVTAQSHVKTEFWERMMVQFSVVPGLTEVALGQTPEILREYEDFPLKYLPMFDDGHPKYEERIYAIYKAHRQNRINAYKRHRVVMELTTGLFASLYLSIQPSNDVFAQHLLELCDYARAGVKGGYFDGKLAFNMLYIKLFGHSRRKTDVSFYNTAREIQIKNRLPDGCKAKDFTSKAHAWIHKIRPNLQQPYTDEDAAEYIIDMMPKALGADARRIKSELMAAGTFLNHAHLIDQLESVVLDTQAVTAPTPGFTAVSKEVAQSFDLHELSNLCGMALQTPKSKPLPALVAGSGGDDDCEWCPGCPHMFRGEKKPCLCDPRKALTWPVSIHENAERKKELLQRKVKNAKDKGIRCAQMSNPSKEAIEAWKKRAAGRGNGGQPRGRGRQATAAGAAVADGADAPDGADSTVAGGVAVENFFGQLREVTDDVNLCAAVFDDTNECATDGCEPREAPADAQDQADAAEVVAPVGFALTKPAGASTEAGAVEAFFASAPDASDTCSPCHVADGAVPAIIAMMVGTDGSGGAAEQSEGSPYHQYDDDTEFFWFVRSADGMFTVHCVADDPAQMEGEVGCVAFGQDELAAREYAARKGPTHAQESEGRAATTPIPMHDLRSPAGVDASGASFAPRALRPLPLVADAPPMPPTAVKVKCMGTGASTQALGPAHMISAQSGLLASAAASKMGDPLGLTPPPPLPADGDLDLDLGTPGLGRCSVGASDGPPKLPTAVRRTARTAQTPAQSRTAVAFGCRPPSTASTAPPAPTRAAAPPAEPLSVQEAAATGGQPTPSKGKPPSHKEMMISKGVPECTYDRLLASYLESLYETLDESDREAAIELNWIDSYWNFDMYVISYIANAQGKEVKAVLSNAVPGAHSPSKVLLPAQSIPYKPPPSLVELGLAVPIIGKSAATPAAPSFAPAAPYVPFTDGSERNLVTDQNMSSGSLSHTPSGGGAPECNRPGSEGAASEASILRACPVMTPSQEGIMQSSPALPSASLSAPVRASEPSPTPTPAPAQDPAPGPMPLSKPARPSASATTPPVQVNHGPDASHGIAPKWWSPHHALRLALLSMALCVAVLTFKITASGKISLAAAGATYGAALDVAKNGAQRLVDGSSVLIHYFACAITTVARWPGAAAIVFILVAIAGAVGAATLPQRAPPSGSSLAHEPFSSPQPYFWKGWTLPAGWG